MRGGPKAVNSCEMKIENQEPSVFAECLAGLCGVLSKTLPLPTYSHVEVLRQVLKFPKQCPDPCLRHRPRSFLYHMMKYSTSNLNS